MNEVVNPTRFMFMLSPESEIYQSVNEGLNTSIHVPPTVLSDEPIQDADETVISEEQIWLMFDYPIEKPMRASLSNEGGFTKEDIRSAVRSGYEKIKLGEEKTMTEHPGKRKPLLNRGTSDGLFGLWGYEIENLYLEMAEYNSENKTVYLFIGS